MARPRGRHGSGGGPRSTGWLFNVAHRTGPFVAEGIGRATDIVFNHILLGFHHFAKTGAGGAIGSLIVEMPGFRRAMYALERRVGPVADPATRPARFVGRRVKRAAKAAARVPVIDEAMTVANEAVKQPSRELGKLRKVWLRTPGGRFASGASSAAVTVGALMLGHYFNVPLMDSLPKPAMETYFYVGAGMGTLKMALPAAIARTGVLAARRELSREAKRNAREELEQELGIERSVAGDEGAEREARVSVQFNAEPLQVLELREQAQAIATEMFGGEIPPTNEDAYELFAQVVTIVEGRLRNGNAVLDFGTDRTFAEIDIELGKRGLDPLDIDAFVGVEPNADADRIQLVRETNARMRFEGADIRSAIRAQALLLVGAESDADRGVDRRRLAGLRRDLERSFDPVADELRLDENAARTVAAALNRHAIAPTQVEEFFRGDNLATVRQLQHQLTTGRGVSRGLTDQLFGDTVVTADSPEWLRTMHTRTQGALRQFASTEVEQPLSPADARALQTVDANLRLAFGEGRGLELSALSRENEALVLGGARPTNRLLLFQADALASRLVGGEPVERIIERKMGQSPAETIENPRRQHWRSLTKVLMGNVRLNDDGRLVLNAEPLAGDRRIPEMVADDSARVVAAALAKYIDPTIELEPRKDQDRTEARTLTTETREQRARLRRDARETLQLQHAFDQETSDRILYLIYPQPNLRQRLCLMPGREDAAVFTPRDDSPPKPRIGTRTAQRFISRDQRGREAMGIAIQVLGGGTWDRQRHTYRYDQPVVSVSADVESDVARKLEQLFMRLDTSDRDNLQFRADEEPVYNRKLAQIIVWAKASAQRRGENVNFDLTNFAPAAQTRIGRELIYQREVARLPAKPKQIYDGVNGFRKEHMGSSDDPDTVRELVSTETILGDLRVLGKGARLTKDEPQLVAREILWPTPEPLVDMAPRFAVDLQLHDPSNDDSVFQDIRTLLAAIEDCRWVYPEAQQAALRIIQSNDVDRIRRFRPDAVEACEFIEQAQEMARVARECAPTHLPPPDDITNLVFQLQGSLRKAADGVQWRLDVPAESPGAIQLALRQIHGRLRANGVAIVPPSIAMFEEKAQDLLTGSDEYNNPDPVQGTRTREELVRAVPFADSSEVLTALVGMKPLNRDATPWGDRYQYMEDELTRILATGPNRTTRVDERGRFVLTRDQQEDFIRVMAPYMEETRSESIDLSCFAPMSRWRIEKANRQRAQRWSDTIAGDSNPFAEDGRWAWDTTDDIAPISPAVGGSISSGTNGHATDLSAGRTHGLDSMVGP